jgi:hypothetical protein
VLNDNELGHIIKTHSQFEHDVFILNFLRRIGVQLQQYHKILTIDTTLAADDDILTPAE